MRNWHYPGQANERMESMGLQGLSIKKYKNSPLGSKDWEEAVFRHWTNKTKKAMAWAHFCRGYHANDMSGNFGPDYEQIEAIEDMTEYSIEDIRIPQLQNNLIRWCLESIPAYNECSSVRAGWYKLYSEYRSWPDHCSLPWMQWSVHLNQQWRKF